MTPSRVGRLISWRALTPHQSCLMWFRMEPFHLSFHFFPSQTLFLGFFQDFHRKTVFRVGLASSKSSFNSLSSKRGTTRKTMKNDGIGSIYTSVGSVQRTMTDQQQNLSNHLIQQVGESRKHTTILMPIWSAMTKVQTWTQAECCPFSTPFRNGNLSPSIDHLQSCEPTSFVFSCVIA